jgi:uncharacterized OB-fold protein
MERAPAEVFAEHRDRGELAYQVDVGGRPVWPPQAGPHGWRVSAGEGTVYACTRVHPRGEEPYDIALVDVDEGFRVLVRGTGPIGRRVTVRFEGEVPVV